MVRKALRDLDKTLSNLPKKQEDIIEKWIETWNSFIQQEKTFLPYRNIKYNEKDIITVRFGYNVGSEQGGNRPSVVIEDNDRNDRTVMVVPLASINSPGESIHNKNVFLGEIPDLNAKTKKPTGTESKALIHQMRAISKQRIVAPTKNHHDIIQISDTQLNLIREKIKEIYC